MKNKSSKNEPKFSEVILDYSMTSAQTGIIATEFMKYLLFQKGQITMAYPHLEKTVDQVKTITTEEEENGGTPIELRKQRLQRLKQEKLHAKFAKNAEEFISNFNSVSKKIQSEICGGADKIAILFGTSIFTAREAFVLNLPTIAERAKESNCDEDAVKYNLACIFRFLVCDETLSTMLSSVRPTLVHVLFWKDLVPCSLSSELVPRVNYTFPPHCRVMSVNFCCKPRLPDLIPIKPRVVCKRLSFSGSSDGEESFPRESPGEPILEISGLTILEPEDVHLPVRVSGSLDHCWFQADLKLKGFCCKI